MNARTFILVSYLLTVSTIAHAAMRGAMVGSYRPIMDLSDPHLQEIGRYAVTQHNQLDGTNLQYVNIIKAESQVVAGTNYRLMISAKDSAALGEYQAVVYERPWDNYRSLTSFVAV